jgi:hydroxyacylglutathione hydrolase
LKNRTTTVERLSGGPWGENCYLIYDEDRNALLIDPGGNPEGILATLRTKRLHLAAILNTHGHFDHIGGVTDVIEATGASFYISAKEAPIMKSANLLRFIFQSKRPVRVPEEYQDLDKMGTNLEFGRIDVQLIATPGHTPGGYCFLVDGALFSGDTILSKMPGTHQLPGGNKEQLLSSLRKLSELEADLKLYPGHGRPLPLQEALSAAGGLFDSR